jgi:flagellin-like protein
MKFLQNDDAVSPVIGVVLMVAITVILAAFIAVLLFGMSNDVPTTKSVAISAKQDGNDVLVTFHGGPDSHSIRWVNITATDMSGSVPSGLTSIAPATGSHSGYSGGDDISIVNGYARYENPDVGLAVWFKGAGTQGKERVVITATFGDVGYQQVVLDQIV